MTMEEDRPVCEVVTQTKCDDQTPRSGETQGELEGGGNSICHWKDLEL